MADNQGKKTNPEDNTWWQEGVSLFSEVTGLIVGPIVAALYGGRALDNIYSTEPVFFLCLTGLAIILSIFFIVRITTRYLDKIDKELKAKNNERQ